MKKCILAIAVTLFTNQAYSQVADDAPASNSTKTHHAKKAVKPYLPPPSKVTIGFYTAFSSLNYDMMELYANQGADISCRNCNREQNSPLHDAVHAGTWGQAIKATQWLIEHGAKVNQANLHGVTPIMMAMERVQMAAQMGPQVAQGDDNLLPYLMQHGANVQAVDDDGDNLLKYLAPVAGEGGGYSVTPPVAYQQIATVLLGNCINVNQQNKIGETALMFAASRCAEDSVKFLLASGADATKINKLKQTALDIAIDKATNSGQNSYCNNTVKLLSNPQQISKSFSAPPVSAENSTPASSGQQSIAAYAGTYSGSYSGNDSGVFEATILADGSATFKGKPNEIFQYFTGSGNVKNDGSVVLKSSEIDSVYTGQIDQNGVLKGTWKSVKYKMSGNFTSNKVATAPAVNPIQALGGLFGGLVKALGTPQH